MGEGRELDAATVICDPPEWQSDVVFTHSLALVLDVTSQRRLAAARGQLRRAGIPVLDHPFHITLCCVDAMDGVAGLLSGVDLPRRLLLDRAELLPSSSGVIALRPGHGTTGSLRSGHRALHERLAGAGVTTFNYYGPSRWQPHVTVGYQVPEPQRGPAEEILGRQAPVEVGFSGISVWTVGTDHVEMLVEF